MLTYLVRRIAIGLLTLLLITFLVYGIVRLMPGTPLTADPANMDPSRQLTPEYHAVWYGVAGGPMRPVLTVCRLQIEDRQEIAVLTIHVAGPDEEIPAVAFDRGKRAAIEHQHKPEHTHREEHISPRGSHSL